MNLTYAALDVKRNVRNITEFFFTAILPLFFYVIFGTLSYATDSVGRGNVNAMVMVTMAMYGAVIATATVGAATATEIQGGWGRQLAMTPLGDARFLLTKLASAVAISLVPIVLIFSAGVVMGAKMPLWAWLTTAGTTAAGALAFAFYGSLFGLWLSSRAASSAASGVMVVLAFLGNMFFPLSGPMLAIAKFTPLYGLVSLVRRPLNEGNMYDGKTVVFEPIWISLTNVGLWTLIFAVATLLLMRRTKARR